MLRPFDPVVPIKRSRRPTPEEVKLRVLQSQRLNKFIDDTTTTKEERQRKVFEALQMLSEIAFDRRLLVLRTLGSIIGNLMKQLYTKVLINETSLNNLKASFGHQQVIYLPSHRSYADFMLMSFICFSYNLEIPAIAAGMDFHGMMGLGEMLRKTGAFFMRRTFGGDEFYWRVFKEYMHEIITFNDLGLEFFVEGTRSRSCKALTPKTGLLSMALEPYFMGEIHDLKIVPISVTYEKPLEEQLFVYELLGIPKPKESTMGFLRAVTNLKNQNLGKIYFDVSEPMTLNEYFAGKVNRFKHAAEPAFVQQLSRQELHLVTDLANEVVRRQQHKIIIMTYNLIALIYNEHVFTGTAKDLTMWKLKQRILELIQLFEGLGAIVSVDCNNMSQDIRETMDIHRNILEATGSNSNVKLIKHNVNLGNGKASKLKGIQLNNETMNIAVPVFSLQLYCNPTLYWLASPGFIVLSLLLNDDADMATLRADFEHFRGVFVYEFVLYPAFAEGDFQRAVEHLSELDVIRSSSQERLQVNKDSKFVNLLLSAIAPFINSFLNTSNVILKTLQGKDFVEKDVFVAAQSHLESELLRGSFEVHPYSLCLDSINLVILSLCNSGCLFKQKQLSISSNVLRFTDPSKSMLQVEDKSSVLDLI